MIALPANVQCCEQEIIDGSFYRCPVLALSSNSRDLDIVSTSK